MTDTCKHCTVRGNIVTCRATPCHTHDSWYAQQQDAEIERLTKDNDKLRGALETEKECIDGDLTSWRASSPKRITAIKDLEWRREFIQAALNKEDKTC